MCNINVAVIAVFINIQDWNFDTIHIYDVNLYAIAAQRTF